MYHLGENDYYWLHSSIDDRFWIIPETVLYEKGYISNVSDTKNRKALQFNSKNIVWLDNYLYTYNNINREKLISLF